MARAENTEVIDKFDNFFRQYYRDQIGELAQNYPDDQRRLYIEWDDLNHFDPDLAADFIAQPEQLRDYAEEALRLYELPVDVSLGMANVRICGLPERTRLADLRARHQGQLVSVYGTIKNASTPRTVPVEAAFECQRCGTLTRIPQPHHTDELIDPHECMGCERQGPFEINNSHSEYIDAQTLLLEQRGPDGTDSNTESILVVVEDDLIGEASIGDHVTVSGVLHLEEQGSYNEGSLADKYLDALGIESSGPFEHLTLTDDHRTNIHELAASDDLYGRIIESIAPSVYDNEEAKLALALQLFGGVTKHLPDGERIRGDVHLLLVGDPAAGQARLTRHIARLAPRAMRISGKTTTQVGLTATAHMAGGNSSPWDVEGGALVLADKGLTAIDRLDAIGQDARESLPTVMEEQVVHVTKASITESLNARTSVLAQAAPKYGRFDEYEPIGEQVNLAPDLISQFDLLFVLTDEPEQGTDEAEANHILDVNYAGEAIANQENAPSPVVDPEDAEAATLEIEPDIDPDLLRRYIAYARQNCFPVMSDEAKDVLQEYYVNLRSQGFEEDTPVPATSRKLEAIVRLAEASARMRLSDTVEKGDAKRVIELVQGTLETFGVDPESGEFDADVIEKGQSKSQRDRRKVIVDIVRELEDQHSDGAPVDKVFEIAEDQGYTRETVEKAIEKLRKQGDLYEPQTDHLRAI